MAKIYASISKELYKVDIHSSSGNTLIADEPESLGGKNLGFSPNELLASSLAACTCATLRMYADRKSWELEEVKLEIYVVSHKKENRTVINRKIEVYGRLDDKQRKRLLEIANKCPVHKLLTNPVEILTHMLKLTVKTQDRMAA